MDVVAFPEMAGPRLPTRDEWERPAFLRECENGASERIREAAREIVVIFATSPWTGGNETRMAAPASTTRCSSRRMAGLSGPEGSVYPFVTKTLNAELSRVRRQPHFYDTRKLAGELGRGRGRFDRGRFPPNNSGSARSFARMGGTPTTRWHPLRDPRREECGILHQRQSARRSPLTRNSKRQSLFAAPRRR